MRRLIWVLVLVLLWMLPFNVKAASDVKLESLTVQLWPDYDRLSVLVIYDFHLGEDVALPTTVRFETPPGAEVVAVAKDSDNGLLTVEYNESAGQEDGKVVTFAVGEKAGYHIEYYLPYALEGQTRDFVFTWPGDYAVEAFTLALQEPISATNLTTDPALTKVPQDKKDGFSYQATSNLKLAARQSFSIHVRYDNDSDTLSASTLRVQPSSSLTETLPGQVSVMTYVPWILAILAVVLIVGGIGWYWFSSRGSGESPRPRRRRKTMQKPALEQESGSQEVYCHECGKRAQADDRFCRTCGTQLRIEK